LGIGFQTLVAYELALQPFVLFHHSNIDLPEKADRIVRALIVSPNMHRVHHSVELSETNSNYSSIFSFWDRIAGTFRFRDDFKTLRYGVLEFLAGPWDRV